METTCLANWFEQSLLLESEVMSKKNLGWKQNTYIFQIGVKFIYFKRSNAVLGLFWTKEREDPGPEPFFEGNFIKDVNKPSALLNFFNTCGWRYTVWNGSRSD